MINFLIGDRSLRRQRDSARDFAQNMYDPSIYAPQRETAERQATQGIDQSRIREGALSQIARMRQDTDIYGGNAGRAVGMAGQQNFAQGRALTDMESQLGIADQQARMQGQQALGQVQSRQLQTAGMRDAAINEADMMYEAERSNRQMALAGTAITAGTTLMGGGSLKGGALQLINFLQGNSSTPGMEEAQEAVANMEIADNPFGRQGATIPSFTARDTMALAAQERLALPSGQRATPTQGTRASTPSPSPAPAQVQAEAAPMQEDNPFIPIQGLAQSRPATGLPSYLMGGTDMSEATPTPQQPTESPYGQVLQGRLGGAIERGVGGFFNRITDPNQYLSTEERARRNQPSPQGAGMFGFDLNQTIERFQAADTNVQPDAMATLGEALSTIDINDDQALTDLRARFIEMGMDPEELDPMIRTILSQLANAQ